MPPSLLRALLTALQESIQRHRRLADDAYEIKVYGYPFSAMGEQRVATRLMLVRIMEVLEAEGWQVYGSVDLNAEQLGRDTWFCIKEE